MSDANNHTEASTVTDESGNLARPAVVDRAAFQAELDRLRAPTTSAPGGADER